jgi:formyl-CoA transferase
MENGTGLLDGVRVIDLTRVLAGPYCTMLLGDLGADIIKIEHPIRGDDTRHWGPPFVEGGQSAYFLCANRNKRSLTLDLKSDQGIEILRELIRKGDVIVDNFRTGTLERWGLSYEELNRLREGMIYCTITGYGYTGPYKDRPGYDFMAQAQGGFMSVNGPVDGEPFRAGVAIADLAAGIFASNAIMAALFARERTGDGQRIDISLLDSMVALMSYVASNYLVSGENPNRFGNAHPNIVPYQEFKSRDGYIALAAGNDKQWGLLCNAIGHPEWVEDERFVNNPKRLENRELLIEYVNREIGRRDSEEWLSVFEEVGIPAASINDMAQTFSDPQVQARNLRVEIPHPTAGTVPLVASPMNIPTSPATVRHPPPLLGQHTDEILSTILNYDEGIIESLRTTGVI